MLCTHYGTYTGFEALALHVPQGRHTLCVEADNRFGEDSAFHVPNDYYSYGGVNRPVLIEVLGGTHGWMSSFDAFRQKTSPITYVWRHLAKRRRRRWTFGRKARFAAA